MNKDLIGKKIKYQLHPNEPVQTGIILDVSVQGDINISGVWYKNIDLIIVEVYDNQINDTDNITQLIFG